MDNASVAGHPAAGGEVTIRPYQPGDAAAVRRLTEEAFGPVSILGALERRWGRAAVPPGWAEAKWRLVAADLQRYADHCAIAVVPSGEVVGCVTAEVTPEMSSGRIPDLMVAGAWRGQGIGRRLLEHALAHFRALGLRTARIETLAHNEVGKHLYPSLGFELVATQHHYAMLLTPQETTE